MSRHNAVRVTKQRQKHSMGKAHKPGKPYRGGNFVGQHPESAKKSSARAAAHRKTLKAA